MRTRFTRPFILAVNLALILGAPCAPVLGLGAAANPTAPQQGAQDVQLVAHIGGQNLDVAVQGDYLYAGEGPSLSILDVSAHLDAPQLLGKSEPLSSGLVNSVAVSGTLAYVGAGSCLWVIDATALTSPAVAGSYCPAWYSGKFNELAISGNHVYIAAADYGLMIVDLSDPLNPAEAATFSTSGSAGGVAVANGYAYIADGSEGLRVVNINNPSAPVGEGSYAPSGFWANRLAVNGTYAYVTGGYNIGDQATAWDGFAVIDISDPANPDQVGTYEMYDQPAYPYDVALANGQAYVVDYNLSRLYVVDVATPATPSQMGYYQTSGWAQAVAVAGDFTYVADKSQGVRVIDVSDPYTPAEAGSYETLGEPQGLAVYGGYAYVADADNGLRIVDVAAPEHPVVTGGYETRHAVNVAVAGGYVYVVNDPCTDKCLQIINTASPTNPTEVGWYDTGWSREVAVSGDRAYVAGTGGMNVVDVSSPAAPSLLGSYDAGSCFALALGGSFAYVTNWSGFDIVSIADPGNPSQVVSWNSASAALDVALGGSLAYVAAGGLHIVRPDLGGPYEVGSYAPGTGEDYQSVALDGSHAYVADWDGGMKVIDVADSGNPDEVGFYDLPGGVGRGVAVDHGYAYLANDEYGLFILQFTPSTSATIPASGGTLTSTPDQTAYTFPSGTFSAPVVISHTLRLAGVPRSGGLAGIGHAFELDAVVASTGQPAQPEPGRTYSVTISYSDAEKGAAIEGTLALHYWDAGQWVKEPSSTVDGAANTMTAHPDHFSLFAVLGETQRVYLSLVLKGY